MKVISTRVHGVLDYVSAITLFALPRILGWGSGVTTFLTIVAATVFIYSLVTRYELSVAKLLPMPGHLLLDAIGGIGLIGAGFLFRDQGAGVLIGLALLGLFELGASMLTESHSSVETAGSMSGSTSRSTGGAQSYGSQSSSSMTDATGEVGQAREVGSVRVYDNPSDKNR